MYFKISLTMKGIIHELVLPHFPIDGASLGRVFSCSLRSRLVCTPFTIGRGVNSDMCRIWPFWIYKPGAKSAHTCARMCSQTCMCSQTHMFARIFSQTCICAHKANITQGGEWLLKNVIIFFYDETNILLKINIDSKQPICMYQLRFSRGPHDLFFGFFLLVELV